MIKKKNIKKDPQRLKHKVRFDIELFQDPKNNEVKLFIVFIQKGGIADGKLLLGDKIKSINGIAVNNKEIQFDNEINKIISCFQNKIIDTDKLEKLLNIQENDDFNKLKDEAFLGNKLNTNKLLSHTSIELEKIIFYLK